MKNYNIWNRQDNINGVEPNHFLNQEPFKSCDCDIILIYADNGKVSNVECKDILANVYGLDVSLDIDSFMAAYFNKLEELEAEAEEESTTE